METLSEGERRTVALQGSDGSIWVEEMVLI